MWYSAGSDARSDSCFVPGRKHLLGFRLTGNVTVKTLVAILPAAVLVVLALVAPGAVVRAEDDSGVRSAKAAAHASLIDRADIPDHPPRLPDSPAEPATRALPSAVRNTGRGEAIRKAKIEAERQAQDAASHAVRADVANRAAAGAAASAARSGNADERAAAGQARARAARGGVAPGSGTPDHPGPPGKNGK